MLTPLVGRSVRIGVYFGRTSTLVPLTGVIGSVDRGMRWVTFRSLRLAEGDATQGWRTPFVREAAKSGLPLQRIAWVEVEDGSRLSLN